MSIVLLIAALVISLFVFGFLVRVLKSAVGTAIAIALIVFAVQFFFGISPDQLLREVSHLWNSLWQQTRQFF